MSVPVVLFVCVQDATMSQMGAALMRRLVGNSVDVRSGGTRPAAAVNELAARVVAEVGASMRGCAPRPLEPALLRRADKVVVRGSQAVVAPIRDMRATVQTWLTGNHRGPGLTEMDSLRLARDDIDELVRDLSDELLAASPPGAAPRPRPEPRPATQFANTPRLPKAIGGAVAWAREGHPSDYGPWGYVPLAAVLPQRTVALGSTDPDASPTDWHGQT